jgi:hypothetical protein
MVPCKFKEVGSGQISFIQFFGVWTTTQCTRPFNGLSDEATERGTLVCIWILGKVSLGTVSLGKDSYSVYLDLAI